MENLDLNIENYSLKDILILFNLTENFGDFELKNAKKTVLMTHPDKSGLDKEVFIFFAEAYKYLKFIFDFRHRNERTVREDLEGSEEDTELIAKIKEKKDFNKVFNELFEEHRMQNGFQKNGYEHWLSSDEGITSKASQTTSMSEMKNVFMQEKRRAMEMVKYNGVQDVVDSSHTELGGQAPENYGSSLFSSLQYEDIKVAHSENIIPVSEEDYDPSKQFKNVTQLQMFRGSQNITPMGEEQTNKYFRDREALEKRESARRAFLIAKQMEEAEEKNKQFLSKFKYLQ